MVCILQISEQIHNLFPSHEIFAVVEQISPITVAGAALEWPYLAHQLPDYPLTNEAPDVENSKNNHILQDKLR